LVGLVLGKTKNIENSLRRMCFFIFFGFLKFNFVVLTRDVDERNSLALIEVEIPRFWAWIETDSRN
jgi:hypothetical protein